MVEYPLDMMVQKVYKQKGLQIRSARDDGGRFLWERDDVTALYGRSRGGGILYESLGIIFSRDASQCLVMNMGLTTKHEQIIRFRMDARGFEEGIQAEDAEFFLYAAGTVMCASYALKMEERYDELVVRGDDDVKRAVEDYVEIVELAKVRVGAESAEPYQKAVIGFLSGHEGLHKVGEALRPYFK